MLSSESHSSGQIPSFVLAAVCLCLTAWPALSQGNITTIAGNGSAAFSGDGGQAANAGLNHPRGMAVDSLGNVYISDVDNRRIRRISPDGVISTIAGNGIFGDSGDGGLAVNASMSDVTGLALDDAGNLYLADAGNRRIRKVTPGGIISTFAGTGVQGFSGDGGPATNAQLNRPTSVLFSAGVLYIADSSNQRVRQVSANGTITTVAGNGIGGFSGDGGPATSASLMFPLGMAKDSFGNLYFADGDNNRVRRVGQDGVVTTVAGNGTGRFAGDQGPAISASLNIPEDVAVDGAGNLLIADAGNNRVRKIDSSGIISTLAGTGTDGYSGDGGPASEAMLSFPWGLMTNAAGSVYIADRVNNRIRVVGGSAAGLPYLIDSSIANGASSARTIAPGAIVSIVGAEFAGSSLSASSVPLPTVLGDTSVTFNGVAVPLFFVSSGRITAQAPFDLPAGSPVSIQVRRGNIASAIRTANVAAVSPGIFIVDQATNSGAVLHADGLMLVGSNSPARPNESLLIYCTGLGPLRTAVRSGDGAPALAETTYLPVVSIAGLPANVTASGLAPGFVGLYQISAQAPAGVPTGNQLVQITTLGIPSNTATIAVVR
ncbi:MAG: hypothetical protein NTY38_06715 [Acidobacteria bacterium]|nr:hypothetical protein [Acidobacteriota bacterium]